MEHHGSGLGRELKASGVSDDDAKQIVAALKTGSDPAELDSQDTAMLEYARKLTRSPQLMTADDVGKLRESGFDDRGIHDICAVVAYFAFVNRIADGLGVELESSETTET